MKIRFESDFSGAHAKTAAMKMFPRAALRTLTDWGGKVIVAIRSAGILKSKSGMMMRNVRMDPQGGDIPKLVIGTGVAGAKEVIYARIQEEGGTTHPTVTDKMRKWAWAMHYKNFGREVRGLGLRGGERKGAWLTWGIGSKYKAIALTKKTRLDVKIPPSHWFSKPLNESLPSLDSMLEAEQLWQVAQKLGEGGRYM